MESKLEKTLRCRIDEALVDAGLAPNLQKARALILAGEVLVDNRPVDKVGTRICSDSVIRLRNEVSRFVGRGGDKIDPVFDHFGISLQDRIAIDIGASTGGFTDAMLQRGAQLVYAVDVGYNQLDLKLRKDSRVRVMEKVNARELSPTQFVPAPTFATLDLSFISLRKVLQPLLKVLKSPLDSSCGILALVKPQFELERELVEAGGVVTNAESQRQAISLVVEFACELGLNFVGECPAALTGQKKGNQEYFIYLTG